jgi:Ca2+-binding EF-hand superfamily protein
LIKQDLSLDHLFAFIDKDKSSTVTIEELSRGLSNILSSDETLQLFMSLDQDNSKTITYEELVSGCSQIHASYILYKIRQAI